MKRNSSSCSGNFLFPYFFHSFLPFLLAYLLNSQLLATVISLLFPLHLSTSITSIAIIVPRGPRKEGEENTLSWLPKSAWEACMALSDLDEFNKVNRSSFSSFPSSTDSY
jgi:hypothetical protein